MTNFSFLACLEVAEKFGVGWRGWVEHVVTVSNLNPSYIEWDLGLGFDNFHPRYIKFELELGLGFDNVSFYIHNS